MKFQKKYSKEIFDFIKNEEGSFEKKWVPAIHIKETLDLNFVAVPQENIQYGKKGWFFAIIARMLEDEGLLEYKKDGLRVFYRTKTTREPFCYTRIARNSRPVSRPSMQKIIKIKNTNKESARNKRGQTTT